MPEEVDDKGGRTFADWYEENGETVREKRRLRYRTDPEYRKRELERGRARRARLAAERAEKGEDQRKPVVHHVETGKGVRKAVTRAAAVEAIGVSVASLRAWMKCGVVPDTPYRTSNNARLWTQPMLTAIRKAVEKRGRRVSRSDETMRAEIERAWAKVGVSAG